MDKMQGETVFAPNAFLRIGTDNKIKILLAHAEMGQGIWTTLTMMIADELDADWKDIEVEHAPAAAAYFHTQMPMQITGGSSTTYSEFDRYRTAGASARILLVMAAAQKLGVAIEACKTENGHVLAEDKMIPYGELVTIAATLKAPEKIPLRTKEQWKYIGKGLKRLDAPDKVNGKAKFGIDYQAKGLLTAVVAHSPVMGGTVKSFDDSKAKLIKGVQQIVKIPTGVAVIADNFFQVVLKIVKRNFYLGVIGLVFICNHFGQRCFIIFALKRNGKCFYAFVVFAGNGGYQATVYSTTEKTAYFQVG